MKFLRLNSKSNKFKWKERNWVWVIRECLGATNTSVLKIHLLCGPQRLVFQMIVWTGANLFLSYVALKIVEWAKRCAEERSLLWCYFNSVLAFCTSFSLQSTDWYCKMRVELFSFLFKCVFDWQNTSMDNRSRWIVWSSVDELGAGFGLWQKADHHVFGALLLRLVLDCYCGFSGVWSLRGPRFLEEVQNPVG